MKDSLGGVIYVGKSKKLKNRVGSYFQNSKSPSSKLINLVKNLKDFQYILTDTEFEAFLLECELIKKFKPRYNRQMKSPKSYTYIKLKMDKKYPDFQISSEKVESHGNLYFGPYTSKNTVAAALEGIRQCYKIPCCNNFKKNTSCLNYSLGLCIGMCLNGPPREQYLTIFNKIVNLLSGADKTIISEMEYKMNTAAEKLDFEMAVKYRDYISAINSLINREKVVKFTEENKNIALLEYLNDDIFKFFLIKGNKILFREKYTLKEYEKLKDILKASILSCFQHETKKGSIHIGKNQIDESQIIYTYLKSKFNSCKYAIISEKWLNSPNDGCLDKAIDKLLSMKYSYEIFINSN